VKLTGIYIYPIKSLGGISLHKSEVEFRGLKHDRRMMLVDKDGLFITQREYPSLGELDCSFEGTDLIVRNKKFPVKSIRIDVNITDSELDAVVWTDEVKTFTMSREYDQYFSDHIGKQCKLVRMYNGSSRKTSEFDGLTAEVSFADGYPFLIVGESSLNDLNERLDDKVEMKRFRPNLVFNNGNPFDEDSWKKFQIGSVQFQVVNKCPRCVVTTINPDTYQAGKEPLKTLSGYRKIENQVYFGVNAVTHSTGTIFIADKILLG